MDVEETTNHAVLLAHYNDDEIRGVERALVDALAPESKAQFLRWILQSVNPGERAQTLAFFQRKITPGVTDLAD